MAKPKTELAQQCPPPPYTRWDQRGNPVLLSYLKLADGKHLCLSLETQDSEIAKGHMRLLVAWSLAKKRLSPDSGAAKVYGPKGRGHSRLKKVNTEVRRLKALSGAIYGPEAVATAKRWGCPVGIIHYLAGRKPVLSAGTHATRRMRARKSGRVMPMGDTWEHHTQGGKSFFLNGRVPTARVHIGSRVWQWPLRGTDKENAEAFMAPVRIARQQLRRAAAEELNCELGTEAAVAAAAARASARAELARAIMTAGGPQELGEFVLKGPGEGVGTAFPQPVQPVSSRRTERRAIKKAASENCVRRYIELIQANPDGAPEPREVLVQKMMDEFGVTFREARICRGVAIERTGNLNWSRHGRPRR
jgi:hypothetical protein